MGKENAPSILFSNKAVMVSFIMSIFIIYAHANNLAYYGLEVENAPLEAALLGIIGVGVGRMAVAYFFAMSGYWFFRFNVDSVDSKTLIKKKLYKKIHTLVIPYLLWNTFSMLFYIVLTRMPFASKVMNAWEPIAITAENLFKGIVLHEYQFTFWYMQDLIVITMFTPLIYFLLKNKRIMEISLVLIGIISCFHIEVYLFQPDSLFCFMLGGYMAVYKRNWFECNKNGKTSFIFLILLIIGAIIRYMEMPFIQYFALIMSPVLIWRAADCFPVAKINWFYRQSFFIYASHIIPVTVLGKILARIGQGRIWAFVSYLVTPWIVLAIIYIMAKILNRYMSGFYKVLCGGR